MLGTRSLYELKDSETHHVPTNLTIQPEPLTQQTRSLREVRMTIDNVQHTILPDERKCFQSVIPFWLRD